MPECKRGQKTPVTIAYGDGIGPEIMTATLRILEGLERDWTSEKNIPARQFSRYTAGSLGVIGKDNGVPQGSDHHTPGGGFKA